MAKKKGNALRIIVGVLGAAVLVLSAGLIVSGRFSARLQGGENTPSEQPETTVLDSEVQEVLDSLSLEQKVAQMFFITPESMTGYSRVTQAGNASKEAFAKYPVGGLVYFAQNLRDPEQTRTMLGNMQQFSEEQTGLPLFLGVDEEGGTVVRIADNAAFGVENIGDMADIGATGDSSKAYDVGETLAGYLKDLGFNVDFAPVADVFSNPKNTVIGKRSFGSDPNVVSEMVVQAVEGLQDNGVAATVKHFPGHGNTTQDSHSGYASSDRTLEELQSMEFLPFEAGVAAGTDFIMVGHITLPNATEEQSPSSINKEVVTDMLRTGLGYSGLIITDAMNMGAITQEYKSAEAAVKAIQAGVDIVLMPEDFQEAYEGVLAAVEDGTLTEERIDESVARIIAEKLAIQNESLNSDVVG